MIKRLSSQRGHADHGWLKSYHSFSFADYYDAQHMSYGNLRVINEDVVAPNTGFGMHPHRDMEIITVVLAGELSHRDSLGNGASIHPGEVQYMSAGTGVRHSEVNPSTTATTHLLQIWLLPERLGAQPHYDQRRYAWQDQVGQLVKVASPLGDDGAIQINADASLYVGSFDGAASASLTLASQRVGYVHVASGEISLNGERLSAGDAMMLSEGAAVHLEQGRRAQVLVFDLRKE